MFGGVCALCTVCSANVRGNNENVCAKGKKLTQSKKLKPGRRRGMGNVFGEVTNEINGEPGRLCAEHHCLLLYFGSVVCCWFFFFRILVFLLHFSVVSYVEICFSVHSRVSEVLNQFYFVENFRLCAAMHVVDTFSHIDSVLSTVTSYAKDRIHIFVSIFLCQVLPRNE